jgi:hypothetical protein
LAVVASILFLEVFKPVSEVDGRADMLPLRSKELSAVESFMLTEPLFYWEVDYILSFRIPLLVFSSSMFYYGAFLEDEHCFFELSIMIEILSSFNLLCKSFCSNFANMQLSFLWETVSEFVFVFCYLKLTLSFLFTVSLSTTSRTIGICLYAKSL